MNVEGLTLEQKKALLRDLMKGRKGPPAPAPAPEPPALDDEIDPTQASLDMFAVGTDKGYSEVQRFNRYAEAINGSDLDVLEVPRMAGNGTTSRLSRREGVLSVVNLATYNYLGYARHPEVIKAAKEALDQYGLGAGGAPTTSGTLDLHRRFEETIEKLYGLPEYDVTLFTTGFGAMSGSIGGLMKPGGCVILDQYAHASLFEGAQLSNARTTTFNHNDLEHLESVLKTVVQDHPRLLIVAEGVYSGEGDVGDIRGIVRLAKKYGALTFVDEAHSALLCGANGRGVCEEQGVLDQVDMIGLTFSKSFGGVGGALVARKAIARYVSWFARCRMFSCALDPAVTAGMTRAVELAMSPDGVERRARLRKNVALMFSLLKGRVNTLRSTTWIIPVLFRDESAVLPLANWLQHEGLDTGLMVYPSVKKGEARLRLFLTSEHTEQQLRTAAEIIVRAADQFGFEATE
jgi:7-keto-8-aminopelargonate synthetase-like enzyme